MRKLLFIVSLFFYNSTINGQQIYPTSYFVKETLIHFYSYGFKSDSFHIVLKDSITSKIKLPELDIPIMILSKSDATQKILDTKNESFHTEYVQLKFKGKDTVDVYVMTRYTETLLVREKRNGKFIKENQVTYPIICFDVYDRLIPICRFVYNLEKGEWAMIKVRPNDKTFR